jgi:hypothetical protein
MAKISAQRTAKTPSEYLKSLPEDRRKAVAAVRKVILDNLPKGFEESIGWGAITYEVPLSILPDTYNGQPLSIVALANQKNYMAVYLMGVYGDEGVHKRFREDYLAAGKKLDMGKACVRFKKLEDLPLEVIGKTIASVSLEKFVACYRKSREGTAKGRKAQSRKK